MNDFFQYVAAMWQLFIEDLGRFFQLAIVDPWSEVGQNFKDYNDVLNLYKPGFGAGGWALFVVYYIIIAALIGGIIFVIFLFFRKLFRFSKKVQEQQELMQQVERLNYELYKAIEERNKILNLKVNALGGRLPEEEEEEEEEDKGPNTECRFTKLALVDAKYKSLDMTMNMDDADKLSLEQLCERFRNFAASQLGLFYELKVIRSFFAGLGASKLLILEGISGTGKTSLPYALGKFFQNDTKICPVQPSWRDRSELIGYYNEFTKRFNETEFLKIIYECTYREDCNVIVLDEMNLARIEYYFAEFLSIMEMPNVNEWIVELISSPDPKTDPAHITDGKMLIPQNLWFIGTANNDDSTFTISDKVYDRAIVLDFLRINDPFEMDYNSEEIHISSEELLSLFKQAQATTEYRLNDEEKSKFKELCDFVLETFNITFGNRIMNQIENFVPVYVALGGTKTEALDFIFSRKVMRKLQGKYDEYVKDGLTKMVRFINALYGKDTLPYTEESIVELRKKLI